jgi:methylated-DNA-protein-cysteine methyltransferase-like protein
MHGLYERIYAVVRLVPKGRVATYGQIARLTGIPGHARQVGYALHALPAYNDVPWYRIINAKGEISLKGEQAGESQQRRLLEQEGVVFDEKGRVSFRRFRWTDSTLPAGSPRACRDRRQ